MKSKPQHMPLIAVWGYRLTTPFAPELITLVEPDRIDWASDEYGKRGGYTIAFTMPGAEPDREFFERYESERAALIANVPQGVPTFLPDHDLMVYRRDGYHLQCNDIGPGFEVDRGGVWVSMLEDHGRRRWLGERFLWRGSNRDDFLKAAGQWIDQAPTFENPHVPALGWRHLCRFCDPY